MRKCSEIKVNNICIIHSIVSYYSLSTIYENIDEEERMKVNLEQDYALCTVDMVRNKWFHAGL